VYWTSSSFDFSEEHIAMKVAEKITEKDEAFSNSAKTMN